MKKMLSAVIMCALMLTGCAERSQHTRVPMIGLEWFASYDSVKTECSNYTLTAERQKEEHQQIQKMLDYADIPLFDMNCDLTLCFNDSGLIGFNYHDTEHQQNYHEWLDTIEIYYGIPTEEGTGMASWYDNPLGKNTAVYLFNLEEGVQVSIYATVDSPDKSYQKQGEPYVPAPEIRTPIVPVLNEIVPEETADTEAETYDTATAVSTSVTGKQTVTATVQNQEIPEIQYETEEEISEDSQEQKETFTTATTSQIQSVTTTVRTSTSAEKTTSTASSVTETVHQETETIKNPAEDFRLNGLQFYSSPDSERKKMSAYSQLYEYRTEEIGQPWELIMKFGRVPYEGKKCDVVLCFTSLGLISINYFDSNPDNYAYWLAQLTQIYGAPDEEQQEYSVWVSSSGTDEIMIYLFALGDGVQISFFVDDTGSELA